MITTPEIILKEASDGLNEQSTDITARRLRVFDKSMKHVLGEAKWGFRIKYATLDVDDGVQEYDLSTELTGYDPLMGIFEVHIGTGDQREQMYPIGYDERSSDSRFQIAPDNKKIIFTKELDGTEVIEISYYSQHVAVSTSTTNLQVPLPDAFSEAVALYMEALVHKAKRQRNDARNKILEYTEVISKLKLSNSSNKAKHLPKTVPPLFQYLGIRRKYTYR